MFPEEIRSTSTPRAEESEPVAPVRLGEWRTKQVKPKKKETSAEPSVVHEPETEPLAELNYPDPDELSLMLKNMAEEMLSKNLKGLGAYLLDPVYSYENHKCVFTVGSKSLKAEIEAQEPTIKDYFRGQKFKLPEIDIQVDALKVKEYKPFTPKEQFNALAKDHPILKEFEERFGLDFDI